MANFCCSIETEPRTLNQDQLNLYREIAVDIVENEEPHEASIIFNEELKPVVAGIKETTVIVVSDINPPPKAVGECTNDVIETQINTNNVESTYCQCSCEAVSAESPINDCRVNYKEPLSAPF